MQMSSSLTAWGIEMKIFRAIWIDFWMGITFLLLFLVVGCRIIGTFKLKSWRDEWDEIFCVEAKTR